jgi:glyoxylate utilization-related uncharacterized protein
MKIRHLSDCKAYPALKHFDVSTIRMQGKDETGIQKFWVGLSYFLPGGGAEWAYEDSPTEKVYMVLDGEVTVKTKEGEATLGPMDTLYLAPNEGRSVLNKTNKVVTMLVVVNY